MQLKQYVTGTRNAIKVLIEIYIYRYGPSVKLRVDKESNLTPLITEAGATSTRAVNIGFLLIPDVDTSVSFSVALACTPRHS